MSACMNQIKSIEEEVLLQCLRDPQNYSFETSFDLQSFQTLCEYHRIRPQLYEMLKNNKTTPSDLLAYLKIHREQWTFRNLAFMAEAKKLNAAFSKADIDIIFYKGGLLSQEIYGDFAIRESSDLDIIVPPNRLIEIGDLLSKLGYKLCRDPQLWGHETFFLSDSEIEWHHEEKQITLDLHWRPNNPRTGLNFSYEDCKTYSRFLELQNDSFRLTALEFTFLLLACHRLKSPQRRLCHLLDLITLFEKSQFNWGTMTKLIEKFKLQKIMAKTLVSILSINPNVSLPQKLLDSLPIGWQQNGIGREDLDCIKNNSSNNKTWLRSSWDFLVYSASNHYSLKKKMACNSFIFLYPSVQVMRTILLKPKIRFLYPLVIPLVYIKLAFQNKS